MCFIVFFNNNKLLFEKILFLLTCLQLFILVSSNGNSQVIIMEQNSTFQIGITFCKNVSESNNSSIKNNPIRHGNGTIPTQTIGSNLCECLCHIRTPFLLNKRSQSKLYAAYILILPNDAKTTYYCACLADTENLRLTTDSFDNVSKPTPSILGTCSRPFLNKPEKANQSFKLKIIIEDYCANIFNNKNDDLTSRQCENYTAKIMVTQIKKPCIQLEGYYCDSKQNLTLSCKIYYTNHRLGNVRKSFGLEFNLNRKSQLCEDLPSIIYFCLPKNTKNENDQNSTHTNYLSSNGVSLDQLDASTHDNDVIHHKHRRKKRQIYYGRFHVSKSTIKPVLISNNTNKLILDDINDNNNNNVSNVNLDEKYKYNNSNISVKFIKSGHSGSNKFKNGHEYSNSKNNNSWLFFTLSISFFATIGIILFVRRCVKCPTPITLIGHSYSQHSQLGGGSGPMTFGSHGIIAKENNHVVKYSVVPLDEFAQIQ